MDDLSMTPRYDGMPISCDSVASTDSGSDENELGILKRIDTRKSAAIKQKEKTLPPPRAMHGLRKSRSKKRVNVKRKPSRVLLKRDKRKEMENTSETKPPIEDTESTTTPTETQYGEKREPSPQKSPTASDILIDLSLLTYQSREGIELLPARYNIESISSFEDATFPVKEGLRDRCSPRLVLDEKGSIATSSNDNIPRTKVMVSSSIPKSERKRAATFTKSNKSDSKNLALKDHVSHCVLDHPSITVSKVETVPSGQECTPESQLASTLLAVSVKRSWIENKKKKGQYEETLSDFPLECVWTDNESEFATIGVHGMNSDDSLTLTVEQQEPLSSLVADRQAKIEKEMDILINSILFKLKNQNAVDGWEEEHGSTICINDGERDVEIELDTSSIHPSSNCVSLDIQREFESNLEAVVNELDILRWPMERVQLKCSPQTEERREDIMTSLRNYMTDSVKSAQVQELMEESRNQKLGNPTNVVSFMKRNSSQSTNDTVSANTVNETKEEYALGRYTKEASNYMYDDVTLDDTLDETLDYTFDETLDYTFDETLGGYTSGTFDSTLDESRVYEHAGFKEIIKLLKTRAANQGISEEALWNRIQTEQKRNETIGPNTTLIEI